MYPASKKRWILFTFICCALIIMPLLNAACGSVAEGWTEKTSMPQARTGLNAITVNNKIYAIGGISLNGYLTGISGFHVLGSRDLAEMGSFLGTNEEYNPVNNTWTTKAAMPTQRILFAIVAVGEKIYCIGGRTPSGYCAVNEAYDTASDSWATLASLPNSGAQVTASAMDGKIYVFGNTSKGGFTQIYDPQNNVWTIKTAIPSSITESPSSAVLGNEIYVMGKDLQIYNPQTDTWRKGPALSWGGGSAVATSGVFVAQQLFCISPRINPLHNIVYNPANGEWTTIADSLTSRYNYAVAVAEDKIYVIGGHTYDFGNLGDTNSVALNEMYKPANYTVPTPTMAPTVTPTPSAKPTSNPTSTMIPAEIGAIAAAVTVLCFTVAVIYVFKQKKRHPPTHLLAEQRCNQQQSTAFADQ